MFLDTGHETAVRVSSEDSRRNHPTEIGDLSTSIGEKTACLTLWLTIQVSASSVGFWIINKSYTAIFPLWLLRGKAQTLILASAIRKRKRSELNF